MEEKNISVKEFIEDYLIGHIGKIKDDYPYEAFLLISCGIEFLGKCLNGRDWHESGYSSVDFYKAIDEFDSLTKYSSIKKDLYACVRCGLCHAFRVKEGILVSDSKPENLVGTDKVINIENFYEMFKLACEDLVTGKKGCSTLANTFFTVKTEESVDGTKRFNTTGGTQTMTTSGTPTC